MPLIIPKTLPAYDALYEENVFVMHRERAASQHIRPLEILILNLMPTKIATETQIDECDSGQLSKGNNVVIKYRPQTPDFAEKVSIYDYVITANVDEENKWSIEGNAKAFLHRLGFDDTSLMVSTLSGGQRKKVALAAALLSRCDILVLDEPTNHLDNDMTEYLEDYLNNYKGALVMVTHDRYFLDKVCNRIVEIDKGKTYSYNTNYEGYLMLKAERENIAIATQNKHQNILRKEIAWMQRAS